MSIKFKDRESGTNSDNRGRSEQNLPRGLEVPFCGSFIGTSPKRSMRQAIKEMGGIEPIVGKGSWGRKVRAQSVGSRANELTATYISI